MTKKTLFIIITVSLFLFMGISLSLSFSLNRETAPVPPNIKMDPTVASQPEEARLLLGKWAGQWNSNWSWDCVLYVEKVEGNYAQVVHSWGEYTTSRMSCHCAPNWARVLLLRQLNM